MSYSELSRGCELQHQQSKLKDPSTQDQIEKLFTTFACLGPVARTWLGVIDMTSDE
ncbi:hypothetical protein HOY82DRAFT_595355 [Tuber indicum]|nr:hypothetical protein HOY82DRAFT_595355 [Tuber indicum]